MRDAKVEELTTLTGSIISRLLLKSKASFGSSMEE
jgi:hypothetical protein